MEQQELLKLIIVILAIGDSLIGRASCRERV